MTSPRTVDEYVATFPPEVAITLEAVRRAIRRATPGTEETIRYGMPTYTLDGRYVVYFAGWRRHVSLYPIPDDPGLEPALEPYRAAKGTLRFRLDEPMPLELIEQIAGTLLRQRRGGSR